MTNVPNDLSPSVYLDLFASHVWCKVFLASFGIILCSYYTNFSNVFDLRFKLSFMSKVIYFYGCPFLMTRKSLRPDIPRWHHAFFWFGRLLALIWCMLLLVTLWGLVCVTIWWVCCSTTSGMGKTVSSIGYLPWMWKIFNTHTILKWVAIFAPSLLPEGANSFL